MDVIRVGEEEVQQREFAWKAILSVQAQVFRKVPYDIEGGPWAPTIQWTKAIAGNGGS